jgi:hydrogenase large subunit
VPCSININEVNAINAERLALVGKLFDDAERFVEQVYIPDLLAVAGFYKDWGDRRRAVELHVLRRPADQRVRRRRPGFKFPRGVILEPQPRRGAARSTRGSDGVQEFITHSWYDYTAATSGLHPWDGETKFNYTGPKPPYEQLEVEQKYSWLKTPRWKGTPWRSARWRACSWRMPRATRRCRTPWAAC